MISVQDTDALIVAMNGMIKISDLLRNNLQMMKLYKREDKNIEDYNPYIKTAITRGKLSRPMRILLEKGILDKNKTIIDVGCGQGEDVGILDDRYGFAITGFDKYNETFKKYSRLEKHYNIVTCN
jgi:cyclopropane fatty-acyl-phospholipid synthase-like methyltransferase